MSEASLCCASGFHSRGGSKALPQDRFSIDHSRNHPNFTLSGKQEKEPRDHHAYYLMRSNYEFQHKIGNY